MKKNIIFTLVLFVFASVSAKAYVDNRYMTTPNFMLNTGYSQEMAMMLNVVNQDPYREHESEPNDASTILKRIYGYIAPTMYTDIPFYNSDINTDTTGWKDY